MGLIFIGILARKLHKPISNLIISLSVFLLNDQWAQTDWSFFFGILVSVHPEMALFALIGVLRGFPVEANRRTPHRKPFCGLDQNKNCSFLNWTPIMFTLR